MEISSCIYNINIYARDSSPSHKDGKYGYYKFKTIKYSSLLQCLIIELAQILS